MPHGTTPQKSEKKLLSSSDVTVKLLLILFCSLVSVESNNAALSETAQPLFHWVTSTKHTHYTIDKMLRKCVRLTNSLAEIANQANLIKCMIDS